MQPFSFDSLIINQTTVTSSGNSLYLNGTAIGGGGATLPAAFAAPMVITGINSGESVIPTQPVFFFQGPDSNNLYMNVRYSSFEFGPSGGSPTLRLDTNPAGYSTIPGATLYAPQGIAMAGGPNAGANNLLYWGGYGWSAGMRSPTTGFVGFFSTASFNTAAPDAMQIYANGGALFGTWSVLTGSLSGKFIGDGSNLTGSPASVNITGTNVDWSLSNTFYLNLSSSPTLTFSNTGSPGNISLAVKNTTSNYTITWPSAVNWQGGSAPVQTTGNHTDIYTFININNTIYGSAVQNF